MLYNNQGLGNSGIWGYGNIGIGMINMRMILRFHIFEFAYSRILIFPNFLNLSLCHFVTL